MTVSQFGRFFTAIALGLSCSAPVWGVPSSKLFSFQDIYESITKNGNVDAVLTALYLEASTDRDRNFVVSLAGEHVGEKPPKWRIDKNTILIPGMRPVNYVIDKYTFGFRVGDSYWYFDQKLSLERNLQTLNRFLETPRGIGETVILPPAWAASWPVYFVLGVGGSILCLTKDVVPFCVAGPLLLVASMVAPASAEPFNNPIKHLSCTPAALGKRTFALTYANGKVHNFAFRATESTVENIVRDGKPADLGSTQTYGVMVTDNVCQDPKKLAAMNVSLEKLTELWPFKEKSSEPAAPGITKESGG